MSLISTTWNQGLNAFRKATAVLFAPSEGSSITMDGTWSSAKLDLSVPMLHPKKRQRV
jgi:hypothetical protein